MVTVKVQITNAQHDEIERIAREQGYKSVAAYVQALIQADVEALRDALEGFREGWRDAMTGNTFPVDTLWDALEDDEPAG
jgi:Arc/MetJ-type ribon-helix-helix transcriptional regulator